MDIKLKVFDNNLDIFYSLEERINVLWILIFDVIYLMKWFFIFIRGGIFN